MTLPGLSTGYLKPPLPQLGKTRRQKNPLQPSKEQLDGSSEVVFPGPFSSAYSTVDTIPLDQAAAEYRQVLSGIREYKKSSVVIGKRASDMPQSSTGAADVEFVSRASSSGSFYSDDE
ncbi:hypothetical protein LPJ66_008686 [Kickxella alabastrina]|uniref:Uncharacterized protein n=1 Tax=Kickxella alabastrina TaxID=61397 RepID=A0ACC1I964_9FUNG|nr:hypothetical protein LPJ66_008686 [Kickxella alabastrina]